MVDHEAENSDEYMALALEGKSSLKACGRVKTICLHTVVTVFRHTGMIVGNGEQFLFPFYDPSFTVGGLAFWTMPVAAGVVTDRFFPTITTFGYMSSQCLCPAQGKCP
jgi:hypothetical protein